MARRIALSSLFLSVSLARRTYANYNGHRTHRRRTHSLPARCTFPCALLIPYFSFSSDAARGRCIARSRASSCPLLFFLSLFLANLYLCLLACFHRLLPCVREIAERLPVRATLTHFARYPGDCLPFSLSLGFRNSQRINMHACTVLSAPSYTCAPAARNPASS